MDFESVGDGRVAIMNADGEEVGLVRYIQRCGREDVCDSVWKDGDVRAIDFADVLCI